MPAPAGGPRAVVGRGAPGAGIEVYKSSQADPSGSGEGRKHLAWGVVGANGEFSVLAAGVTPGDWLTATATVGKDTSEFSVAVRVTQ
jgi:hypothetical protein